jgi:hypothetical protein
VRAVIDGLGWWVFYFDASFELLFVSIEAYCTGVMAEE